MSERNPFAKKNTELFADVPTFLRFYSHHGIKRLISVASSPLLEGTWIFRSPPGFGKSTNFRLFTPATLRELQNQRNAKSHVHSDTITELNSLGVFGQSHPKVLGVYINVADGFSEIHEIFDDKALPVFRAFINAKLILMLVAALKDFYNLQFEDSLDDFTIEVDNDISWGALPKTSSLQSLSDWAENAELQIIKGISNLELADEKHLLHTEYSALKWLRKVKFLYKGKRHILKTLVMFDDVHNLARSQRDDLLTSITVIRPHYPIWIGERLTSLTEKETLIEGADQHRDYNVINLDHIEANTKNNYFKQFVEGIIKARLDMSSVGGFDNWLTINGIERDNACEKAYQELLPRINKLRADGGFSEWFERDNYENLEVTHALVVEMQSLLTSHAKYVNKNPNQLMFEESLDKKPKADASFVEYYLYTQYQVPYYIGNEVLTKYSTSSIFEVLQIAENFFEAIYKASMKQNSSNSSLKIKIQQQTLKELAREKFEKLGGIVRYSDCAIRLVKNFAKTAYIKSNRESSPYVPSITGFALSYSDMAKLVYDENYEVLNAILTDLRKRNLVTITKPKNKEVSVFYLNRLLCVHFDLAGGYGGWNKFSLDTLTEWMNSDTVNVITQDDKPTPQGEFDYE